LQVADLSRSLSFYERVLGLRARRVSPGNATLHAADDASPLIELTERPGARPVPRRGTLGLYHFAILVPDRPALGRFLAHLAATGVAAGMSDHLVSEAVYLHDPDGLGIEVYADRPRATWRYQGSELAMASDTLDAVSVIDAAKGERWTGMPRGTVVGHLHLRVGDLADAEAFYHRALGLDVMVRSYPGALFLSAGGYHHHLGTNTWSAGAERAGPDDARLLSWSLLVPDEPSLAAAGERLMRAGHEVTRTTGEAVAHDPWGTALRLAVTAR
jgi:catechol 2,3-dioxygenase